MNRLAVWCNDSVEIHHYYPPPPYHHHQEAEYTTNQSNRCIDRSISIDSNITTNLHRRGISMYILYLSNMIAGQGNAQLRLSRYCQGI
jgi:hypothetical protein